MEHQYLKELDTPVWQARLRVTQTGVAGGNTVINFYTGNGTRVLLKSIQIKASSLAGNRTFYFNVIDDDGSGVTARLAYAVSVSSGGNLTFPHGGNIQNNNSTLFREVNRE